MPRESDYQITLGPYPFNQDGVTEPIDVGEFVNVGLQAVVLGNDRNTGQIVPQVSMALDLDDPYAAFDNYTAPFDVDSGGDSHTWQIGIFSGRWVRFSIDRGTNTTGTVKFFLFGKTR